MSATKTKTTPLEDIDREYEKLRWYLNKATNWEPEPKEPASFYANRLREEWRGRYLPDALLMFERLRGLFNAKQN